MQLKLAQDKERDLSAENLVRHRSELKLTPVKGPLPKNMDKLSPPVQELRAENAIINTYTAFKAINFNFSASLKKLM